MASAPKWRDALESLPETPDNIPAFFFAHGSPALAREKLKDENPLLKSQGAGSPLYNFLAEFGPTLLKKYKPRGILVFSAHWETADQRLGEIQVPVHAKTYNVVRSNRLWGRKPIAL